MVSMRNENIFQKSNPQCLWESKGTTLIPLAKVYKLLSPIENYIKI